MLIAASIPEEGRKILFIGLQEENIRRLKNDEPIMKDLNEEGVPGLEEWKICIMGPEDMERFIAQTGPQARRKNAD